MTTRIFSAIVFLTIAWSGCAQDMAFDLHTIETNFAGMHCVKLFDMDGDGDTDIVGGSEWTPYSQSIGLAWWRNDGGDPIQWTRFTVDRYFDHVMSVDVAFIDSDVHPDIIATSWSLHQIAWWKHSGNTESGWSKRVVRTGFTNAHDARGADVDQDGHTDIVGVSSGSAEVVVCYNDGSATPRWNTQVLTGTFNGGKLLSVLDFDGDDDLDIIGTASDAGRISWWEHGGESPVDWTSHTIATGFPGAGGLDVVDVNGDGLLDVVASSWQMNEVSYWICEALATDQWQKTRLTNQLPVAVNVGGTDLDQDGDVDVVAVGKIPGEINIYKNDQFSWVRTNLKSYFEGGTALAVEDLDQDGNVDIVAGASGLGDLYWWENVSETSVPDKAAAPIEETFLLYSNYPNPFNPTTTIRYRLERGSKVSLRIYNVYGNLVRCLVNETRMQEGTYFVLWDGKNETGSSVNSGCYFYRLQTDDSFETRKMLLLY